MRNLLIITATLMIFSCTQNETCIGDTVQNDIWIQDSGNFATGNLRFDEDDSVTFLSNGSRKHYQFDGNCSGIDFSPAIISITHWDFIERGSNNISLSSGPNIVYYHRQ